MPKAKHKKPVHKYLLYFPETMWERIEKQVEKINSGTEVKRSTHSILLTWIEDKLILLEKEADY